MTSTLTHLAFAAILASALLGAYFDRRSLAVVLVVTAFPDLDSFIALWSTVGHRALLHTLWIPFVWGVLLWVDTRRKRSLVLDRWGPWAVRAMWVSIVCYIFAHIMLDMVSGVVNPLWPVHDQFYALDGKIELSDQRGIVQTFVEWEKGSAAPAPDSYGTTDDVQVSTGVDPDPGGTEEDPERIFPVVRAGWEVVVILASVVVTAARFRFDDHDEE